MTNIRMISAASGVIEPSDLWSSRISSHFADLCPRMIETETGVRWTAAGKLAPEPGYAHALTDPHGHARPLTIARTDWLASPEGRRWIQDEDQVAGEVLYSTGHVWDLINATEDRDFIVECYRAYNDWLGDFCESDSERFIGVAKVPTTGADDATAELKRAHGLGLKGVVLDAWPGGADCPPAMEECTEFWSTAARLGMPIAIYRPLDGTREPDLGITAGLPPEFYNDLTTIIYANIADNNPDIRFISLAPNAGWAPPAFEQLSDTYMRTSALRKISLADPDLTPSDYLRRYFWYVVQDDRTALLNAGYMGEAHLVWGSFAFMDNASVWPGTRQLFERVSSGMDRTFAARIAGDNASRLYRLGYARPFSAVVVLTYESYAMM
jgi:predicted TIM-barrel fold metal-dependent hydrolase